MSGKYTEIFRLRSILEDANIAYVFSDRSITSEKYTNESYQIEIQKASGKRLISIVQGDCTYGGCANLLEIMGLLTPQEANEDSVVGWLTAEDVFERVKRALSV